MSASSDQWPNESVDVVVIPGRWMFVGFAYDATSNTLKVYADGHEVDSVEYCEDPDDCDATEPFIVNDNVPMQFGRELDSDHVRGLVGDIAKAFLFATALTKGQMDFFAFDRRTSLPPMPLKVVERVFADVGDAEATVLRTYSPFVLLQSKISNVGVKPSASSSRNPPPCPDDTVWSSAELQTGDNDTLLFDSQYETSVLLLKFSAPPDLGELTPATGLSYFFAVDFDAIDDTGDSFVDFCDAQPNNHDNNRVYEFSSSSSAEVPEEFEETFRLLSTDCPDGECRVLVQLSAKQTPASMKFALFKLKDEFLRIAFESIDEPFERTATLPWTTSANKPSRTVITATATNKNINNSSNESSDQRPSDADPLSNREKASGVPISSNTPDDSSVPVPIIVGVVAILVVLAFVGGALALVAWRTKQKNNKRVQKESSDVEPNYGSTSLANID